MAAAEPELQLPAMLITCQAPPWATPKAAQRAAQTALERAEKAVAQDRSNGTAMSWRGRALSVLGEEGRAEWMSRALLIDPDNKNMRYNFACDLTVQLQRHGRRDRDALSIAAGRDHRLPELCLCRP